MKCAVCGIELKEKRRKTCSTECSKQHKKAYLKKYHHEANEKAKKQKFACMMCERKRCKHEHEICKQCKDSEVYQSYGYGVPCAIHS